MKKQQIIEVLEKYHVSYDIAFAIADELQTKELTDDEIIQAAYKAFPYNSEGIPDSHSYSFCQGAEWYREQLKQ